MKQVVNDALRPTVVATAEPYRLTPHESTVRPGLDLSGFNRLVDDLDDEQIMDRAARRS